jgi:hypothetical protein
LGAGADSLRYFTRTDRAYRTNYELIRQGKMPESESMLGKFLNRILSEPNKHKVRAQQLEAEKLPDYESVRRYFGPAGGYVRAAEDGWLISGVLLHEPPLRDADAEQANPPADPATSAAEPQASIRQ